MGKLSASERIEMRAVVLAGAFTALIYWLLPMFPWWVYLLVWALAAGIWSRQWLKHAARKRVVDHADRP